MVDVVEVVEELRAEVARRRAAGDYDEALLSALHREFTIGADEPPEALAYIGTVRTLNSDRRGLGPTVVFSKRVIRRLVAWYVQPIAEDQTRFNIAVIRMMRRLEGRLEARIVDEGYAAALRSWAGDIESKLLTDVESVAEFMRIQSRRMERIEAAVAAHGVASPAPGKGVDIPVTAFAVESLAGLRGARVLVVAPGNAMLLTLLTALGHEVSSVVPPAPGDLDAAVLSLGRSRHPDPGAAATEVERVCGAMHGGGTFVIASPTRIDLAAINGDVSIQRFAVNHEGSWRIVDEPPGPSEDAVILIAGTTRQ
jgi:hypothetical protein